MSRVTPREPDKIQISDLIVTLIACNDQGNHEVAENYLLAWVHDYRNTELGRAIVKELVLYETWLGDSFSKKVADAVKPASSVNVWRYKGERKRSDTELLGTSKALNNNVGFMQLVAEDIFRHEEKESR